MRCLVDTNIIIDFLQRRDPFYEKARLLMMLGKLGEVELWMSPSQMDGLFYILTEGGKPALAQQARTQLSMLREAIRVCSIDQDDVDWVISSTWDDLEDALVYAASFKTKATAIVTRDKTGFKQSPIKTLDCSALFEEIKRKNGLDYELI